MSNFVEMKYFASLTVVLCFLGGCAATGVKVSEDQARSFRVGSSTYSEVVGQLGAPTTTSFTSSGIQIASYSYATVAARPQNFIPYIGPFVSGYDTSASAVTFTFNANGILTNMASTHTNIGTGVNLAAGNPQQVKASAY